MCEYLRYDIVKLKRIRIMNVQLDLPTGEWTDLSDAQMTEINRLVEDSKKSVN